MAYDDYNEREQGLDRGAELYDEGLYEEEFGERLDRTSPADEATMEDQISDDPTLESNKQTDSSQLEDSFGESISQNPHIEDQLQDQGLSQEAERDYGNTHAASPIESQNESLMDKAKDKINELSGHDKDK